MPERECRPDEPPRTNGPRDSARIAKLFDEHRARLRLLASFRLDPRLRGRVDVDDVLQESFVSASGRAEHAPHEDGTRAFLWLRLIVLQTLVDLHRRHLGAQMRDAEREVHWPTPAGSSDTSLSLVSRLVGQLTSPTHAARRAELGQLLRGALDRMDPIDREVLALRHFEELSNGEVAQVLGIQSNTASIRYVRALRRLRELLAELPGFSEAYGQGI